VTEKFIKAALQMPTEDPTRTPITFTLTNEASAYIVQDGCHNCAFCSVDNDEDGGQLLYHCTHPGASQTIPSPHYTSSHLDGIAVNPAGICPHWYFTDYRHWIAADQYPARKERRT